jgi:hypothetical protein
MCQILIYILHCSSIHGCCILIAVKHSRFPRLLRSAEGYWFEGFVCCVSCLPADPCAWRGLANCRHAAVSCILLPSPSAKAPPLANDFAVGTVAAAGGVLYGTRLATRVAAVASIHWAGNLCSGPHGKTRRDSRGHAAQHGAFWLGMTASEFVMAPAWGTSWIVWGCGGG